MKGCVLADAVEVVDGERNVELVGDGDEVEDGVGGPPEAQTAVMAFSMDLRVRILLGREVVAGELHDELPASREAACFSADMAGTPVSLDGRDAEELAGHGHGVGGELAAAGSGAGAGGGFDGFELVVVDLAGGVGADGFEDVEDGDVFASVPSGWVRWPGAMEPP